MWKGADEPGYTTRVAPQPSDAGGVSRDGRIVACGSTGAIALTRPVVAAG